MITRHPCQDILPEPIEGEWRAALYDAALMRPAVLFVLRGRQSQTEKVFACHLPYRRHLEPDVPGDALRRLNGAEDDCRECHRVLLWTEGRPAAVEAALLRHELRHAEQYEAARETFELAGLATDVVRTAPTHSGRLYNQIPNEKDANGSAYHYVVQRFGLAVVESAGLGFDGPPVLREETPTDLHDLPRRIVEFLRTKRDLCIGFASAIPGVDDAEATFYRLLVEAAGDEELANYWNGG